MIGPTLILIYINDLPDYVNSAVHLFADDTIMYLTVHNEDHCDQLQADIDQLQLWEKHWSMEFNPEKCELLRITRKRTAIERQYVYPTRQSLKGSEEHKIPWGPSFK